MKSFEQFKEEFYSGKCENGIFTTTNEKGENAIVEITNEFFSISTIQNNGWIRVNTYYKDGCIEEEYKR